MYKDTSDHFSRRFEYLSYYRDKHTLEGITYGDIIMDKVMSFYKKPKVKIISLTHKVSNNKMIEGKAEKDIQFRFNVKVPGRLKEFSYQCATSPITINPSLQEAGQTYTYDVQGNFLRYKDFPLTFKFPAPRIYKYQYECTDWIDPTPDKTHKIQGTLTFIVSGFGVFNDTFKLTSSKN